VHLVIKALVLGLVTVFMIAAVWDIASRTSQDRLKAETSAQELRDRAQEQMQRRCVAMEAHALIACVREIIEASDEHQRANYDLAAQQGMDEWAFWMMWTGVFSAGVTAIGVYWVKETLAETRKAVRAADDAVVVTRQIGEAQTRA
jgi:hypothetical protein